MQKFKDILRISLTISGCILGIVIGLGLIFLSVGAVFVYNLDAKKGINIEERWDSLWGGRRVLSKLQERVNEIPTPEKTIFISEYGVESICCGQGESHYKTPTVTRLYESNLSKDQITNFYKIYGVGIYFVDEVIGWYPDRRPNLPCYPFNLFSGHHIPQELPKDKNLYILIASDKYTPLNPKIVYCD